MILASPSERSRKRWKRLSADPPLMGFVVCPAADMPRARPLREAEASVGPTVPPASHVPPSWFRTTSTVCSAQRVAGLLHPAASQGFAAFRVLPPPASPESDRGGRGQSPRRGSHPSKSSPRQQPYRITAAVAFVLLPFTARLWGWAEAALHDHPRPTGAGRETHRPGSRGRQRWLPRETAGGMRDGPSMR